jgi:polyhydroxyalkanoate synthesis regulator phasin
MATRSGGSRSTRSGGTRKRTTSKRSSGTTKRSSARRSTAAGRSDKSVQAFRDALERSVTLSRDRLQEVVDDAVARGRMTRGDANELVSNLVSRGRKHSDDLIRDLEKLLDQARKEVEARTATTRTRVTRGAGRVGRGVRDAADRPLASADRARRRAGRRAEEAGLPRVPIAPITAYDRLTAPQVKSRLGDLTKAELRKVRTQEKRGKARKGVLDDIEKRLAK